MRVVIYDAEDMEPITVVEVPQHFVREIEAGGRDPILRFPIPNPGHLSGFLVPEPPQTFQLKFVTVRFEPIMKNGKRMMWLATTMDGETALLLRSVFLPGQRGAVERESREAFFKGFMAAVA